MRVAIWGLDPFVPRILDDDIARGNSGQRLDMEHEH